VIEDSFSDEQFFRVARELVDILFRTASNEAVRKYPPIVKDVADFVNFRGPTTLKPLQYRYSGRASKS